jgi:hypothetical protein
VAEAAEEVVVGEWVQTTAEDFAEGFFLGTAAVETGGGEIRLAAGQRQGTFTSPQSAASFPVQTAGLLYRATVPAGAGISFELRAQDEAGEWSPWMTIPTGPWAGPDGRAAGEALVAFAQAGVSLQYRVTMSAQEDSPRVEEVVVVYLAAEPGPRVEALPPWREADGRPNPVPPQEWGAGPPAEAAVENTIGPLRIEVRPAALAWDDLDAVPMLRMAQLFYETAFALDDLPYTFLVDPQGGIYQGRSGPAGDILYIGVLGAHPNELFSPVVEDALVALLDWWGESQAIDPTAVTLGTPADPLLAERLLARWQAGNVRRGDWFLARGAVAAAMHEWLLLANPSEERAWVTVDFHSEGGQVVRRSISLAGESRGSLFANQVSEEGTLWAQVRAASDILVERAMYYGHDGDAGVGLERLSRVWYFPGGTQEPGFTTTLTLLNPAEESVTTTVSVYAPSGLAAERTVTVAPQSRLDLPVAGFYTGTTPVGCRVLADEPIAAEQGVRFSAAGGGYATAATPVLSTRWTFASVETEYPYVTVLALLNPHERPVAITLTLMSEDGTTLRRSYPVPPGEQVLNVNTILPELALAAEIQAARPIAVARITFFNQLRSAHATVGAVRPTRNWYLAEGSTGKPFETFLLVANPNGVASSIEITLFGSKGELEKLKLRMPAHARLTVPLNEVVPGVSGLSTYVSSEWPVVVERSMYMHGRQGGHAHVGIPR